MNYYQNYQCFLAEVVDKVHCITYFLSFIWGVVLIYIFITALKKIKTKKETLYRKFDFHFIRSKK